MIRAFVAIAVPDAVLERCQEISHHLREMKLEGRFLRAESIHLTLKFLGNVEPEVVPGVVEVLKTTAQETAPFDLQVEGVGVFPHLTRPRVVWFGVEQCEALCGMQERMEKRFERLGFSQEKRRFHPHLTLARIKSRKNLSELVRYVQTSGPRERADPIRVRDIHLYQSVLKPQGAEYRKLQTAKLA